MKRFTSMLSTLAVAALCLTATSAHADDTQPVKVYILSGQSNMVGIGTVGPTGMTRFNTYVSPDKGADKGVTLYAYQGTYDPDKDYAKEDAAATSHLNLGYWPHTAGETIEGDAFYIAHGYIRIDRKGKYSFSTTHDSMFFVDGQKVFERDGKQEVLKKKIDLEPGTHPIKAVFLGNPRSNLTHNLWDQPGTLHTAARVNGKFPFLLDEEGNWASRDDVYYKGVVTAGADQWLSVGCGASKGKIGPELGFGHVIGDYHDQPVLIIKASQGNRSLAWDFCPPGTERYTVGDTVYAGYKDSPSKWEKGTEPEPIGWYAGKQYDDCFNATKDVLKNFDKNFPFWEGRGYEIAGFVWWQGHKDSGSEVYRQRYEQNLANLINALRDDFNAPDAPFVVGTIGFHGKDMPEQYLPIAKAQLNISDPQRHPEFKGNVNSVDTRPFWIPASESPRNQDYHYNQNGVTYLTIGMALGKGMVELKDNE